VEGICPNPIEFQCSYFYRNTEEKSKFLAKKVFETMLGSGPSEHKVVMFLL
jgi:hypothetical protein